jgi:hypothetical protein
VSRALPPVGVHRTVEQLPQRTTVWECENTVVLRCGKGGVWDAGEREASEARRPAAIAAPTAAGGRQCAQPCPAAPTAPCSTHMLKHPWHLTSWWGNEGGRGHQHAVAGPKGAPAAGCRAPAPAQDDVPPLSALLASPLTMKKELGDCTKRLSLCFCFSSSAGGLSRSISLCSTCVLRRRWRQRGPGTPACARQQPPPGAPAERSSASPSCQSGRTGLDAAGKRESLGQRGRFVGPAWGGASPASRVQARRVGPGSFEARSRSL